MQDRPLPIVVLGLLSAGIGAALLTSGLALLGVAQVAFLVDANAAGVTGSMVGVAELGVGVASLVLAFGFWLRRDWAWGLGLAVFGLSLALSVAAVVVGMRIGTPLFLGALSVLMIWMLYTPRVRALYHH
ncbi:MAG: hypothetical protein KF809_14585 [Chloroflexi bacterium]|nr:hypothetical protein [Chloroflexota bacterium]